MKNEDFLWVLGVLATLPVNFQKLAFACQRLTQISGSLLTKSVVKWVSTAKEFYRQNDHLRVLKKDKIIARKIFLQNIFCADRLFCL